MKKTVIRIVAGLGAVLLLVMLLLSAVPAVLYAAPLGGNVTKALTRVEVEPGYDYERFKGQNITLNVYNWGEYISTGTDGESLDVNAAFSELTGIKVNYTTFDTNESLRSKLKSGGADYDVIIPSDYMVGMMAQEGMLAPLNFDNIPNYSMIGEQYKGMDYDIDNEYSVPYTWGYVGIIYNTTMVEGEVDSWNVLWDEQYADNILMFDNSRDAFAIALKKLGLSLNPASNGEIDLATEELMLQRGVVQAYVMDQIFDKMEGGEAALAPYYAGDAITMMEENPDLAFAIPQEGTNYFVDAMCIPATSRNKEAAEMYINFMCETEVAKENCLAIGYSTPQIEAEAILPDEIKNNPIAYPSTEELENMETFTVLPDDINRYMDKAWSDMRSANVEVDDEGNIKNSNGWMIPVMLLAAVALVIALGVRRNIKKKRNNY